MRCAKARTYIDLSHGGLEEAKQARLEEHLSQCVSCRAYKAQDQALGAMIGKAPATEFPQWVHARIIEQSREHDPRRVHIKHLNRWKAVPTMAAIAFSLYLGGLVGSKSFTTGSSVSSSGTSSAQQITQYASFGESTLLELDYSDGE